MLIYIFSLFAFLVSCGAMDGEDGTKGANGVDGKSPRCSVEKKENRTYLVCKNPDGTAAEAEISIAGDEIATPTMLAQCSMKNQLYSVRYNVISVSEGLKLSSMAVTHLKTPKVFYQGAVLHADGDEGYASSEIKLSAWSAKLVAPKKAEVVQAGGSPEAVLCK